MNTRKTLLAFAAASAFALPLALAAPANANPGGCSNENAGAAGQTLPRCGSDLLHGLGVDSSVHVNVHGGTCDSDTLLLIQVRANEHDAHQRVARARTDYSNAAAALKTAQEAYTTGYTNWTAPAGTVKTEAAYQATAPGAALHNTVVTDQATEVKTRKALEEALEADNTLTAQIKILTGRINGVECHPVTTTPVPPPTTDVPPPPVTVVVPPPAVIVPGPSTVIEPGPSQIGQAPQGYTSAGGGADAALVQAFSS